MQDGEMIVLDEGVVQVELNGLPIRIIVEFSDRGEVIATCDPHHHHSDKLEWEINRNIITIKWQVFGIREIKWKAWFYLSEL